MKPQLTGAKKRPSVDKPAALDAALSLQEELVAAIHGAFEVAVEIAVHEVTKLVGQATGDVYEEMRRENESLKQRLRRAEALLDCARREESCGSPPPPKQLLDATDHTDQPCRSKCNQKSANPKVGNVQGCTGVRDDRFPPCHSRVDQPSDPQHKHKGKNEEQRSGGDAKTQHVSDAALEKNNGCADALTRGVSEEMSQVCVVRIESLNQSRRDLDLVEDCDTPPLPSRGDKTTLEQVTVKQEKPEEERDGSVCCLDAIKVEDFTPECMLAVQSKMLEEWKPEGLDAQNQDANTSVSCTGLAQTHLPNLTTNLQPPADLPSSEFPNINIGWELAEPGPIPETPPQIYGVHVRTSRNHPGHNNLYTCKSCGQTFHLPSLLRRHYGQCQQKQSYQQPVAESRRTRLQLYPPGCSPFCCTVCNREFNRMENLKTHLRIHTGERPYTCSVCSKCFRHSGALTRHFRIHTGEKPYICGQCGKSFRNCGGLKFHQRSHNKQLQ